MDRSLKRGILRALILLNFLFYPSTLIAAKNPVNSAHEGAVLNRPVLITTTDSEFGTMVEILGNEKIAEFRTLALASPPMIVVDIFRRVRSFESVTIPQKSPNLRGIRLGHHPEKIRVVLDIQGGRIPPFYTESAKNRVSLFLRSGELAETKVINPRNQTKSEETRQPQRASKGGVDAHEKLIQIPKDDGQEDTALFLAGLRAYRDQAWWMAFEHLQQLLTDYPTGRYSERAHFLMAEAFDQSQSNSIVTHFTEANHFYAEAIRKFPQSIHVVGALLAIGDLYSRIDNTYEALGYYKLVLRKEKDSIPAQKATIGIARIMALRKNRKEAVGLLEKVIGKHPDSVENTVASIEMGKVLYEMNHFLKSSEVLSNLITTNPENRYRFPEISLYLGYNYYQLGENRRSRENLLRYYNSCPEKEQNHLILTKIGDTYREEGAFREAAEFYNLVITLHPDREGAVISRIRLAELKEDGALEPVSALASGTNILGKEQGSAKEIYEKILSTPFEQDQKKSLEQLTLLKLAILEQNEEDYEKSLRTLRTLLDKFPGTSLEKDSKKALKKSLRASIDKEIERGKNRNVIKIYEREKDLFSKIDDPNLFVKVARAAIDLDLQDMAAELFKKADTQWANKEKPPDLLFFLAEDLFKREKLKPAMVKADLILKKYPSDPYAPSAYQLKGRIFFKQKNSKKALEMFSLAEGFDLDPCMRTRFMIDQGKALVGGGFPKKAMVSLREANRSRRDCDKSDTSMDREMGDLFLSLGHPKEALSIFDHALSVEKNEEEVILIKLKVAECYWLMDKKDDSLALYNQLAALDDPFWSNLAKERLDEMTFKTELETIKGD